MNRTTQDYDRRAILRRARREGVHRIRLEPWCADLYAFKGVASYPARFERIFGMPSRIEPCDETEVGGFFVVDIGPNQIAIPALVISDDPPTYPEEFIWHEALHATFILLDNYGVKFDVDNHEVYNYTQARIVSEVRQHLYGLEGFR